MSASCAAVGASIFSFVMKDYVDETGKVWVCISSGECDGKSGFAMTFHLAVGLVLCMIFKKFVTKSVELMEETFWKHALSMWTRTPWMPQFKEHATVCNKNIILIGNPGVGKSTLLSGFAQKALFQSGFSLGGGLSSFLQKERHNGVVLIDTPGLGDVHNPDKCANEINEGLRSGGLFKILFIVCLQEGRMRPDDLAVMELVLKAAQQIGTEYGVVINKADTDTIKAFADRSTIHQRTGFEYATT